MRSALPRGCRCHASESASDRRQPFKKGSVPPCIGRTKGGLNSKLHAVCDGKGRRLVMLLSEGQMIDFKGAALMLPALPKAKELLGDKGYDADWFRQALAERKTVACIPSKSKSRFMIQREASDSLRGWPCGRTKIAAVMIAAAFAIRAI